MHNKLPSFCNPQSAIRNQNRPAFTLIELLIVIGIIVLLVGLAVPAILHSYKQARRIRTQSDFQLIGTALEAYKVDFHDYPRFDKDYTVNSLNVQQDRGARLLCRALLAPGPAQVTTTPVGTPDFLGFNNGGTGEAPDGADGNGFRTRPGGTGAGQVYGPYIQSDKFKLGNPGAVTATTKTWDSTYFTDATLLDPEGNPILYYPATPGVSNYSATGAYITTYNPQNPGTENAANSSSYPYPLYNAYDNAGYGSNGSIQYPYLTVTQLQYILGARSTTSQNTGTLGTTLTPPETAVTTQAYLLWSAGEDGTFGRTSQLNGKTDDVTNFDLPSDLQK